MKTNSDGKIANDLLSIGAVFLRPENPFTWASGIKSPIYCDNRLTLTAPKVRTDIETAFAKLIEEKYPDSIQDRASKRLLMMAGIPFRKYEGKKLTIEVSEDE